MPHDIPTMQVVEWLFGVCFGIISLLLFGNLFFLRKLIEKVDLIDPLVANMTNLTERLNEICGRIDLINDLRVEIAELRARFFKDRSND